MTIALAADHAGYQQAKELQSWLEAMGHTCQNFGPANFQPDDDYPDFVKAAAVAVASGKSQRGIVLGGDGQGEAMAANRLRGIRCAVFYGPAVAKKVVDAQGRTSHDPYEIVRLSRLHNDSNMLAVAARFVNLEDIKNVVKLWLEVPFSNDPRHQRRIAKLDKDS